MAYANAWSGWCWFGCCSAKQTSFISYLSGRFRRLALRTTLVVSQHKITVYPFKHKPGWTVACKAKHVLIHGPAWHTKHWKMNISQDEHHILACIFTECWFVTDNKIWQISLCQHTCTKTQMTFMPCCWLNLFMPNCTAAMAAEHTARSFVA